MSHLYKIDSWSLKCGSQSRDENERRELMIQFGGISQGQKEESAFEHHTRENIDSLQKNANY